MGWLGWNEKDSLAADVNSIMVAMEGKLEMLYPEAKKQLSDKKQFNNRFKSFVKSHNAHIKANRGK